MLPLRGLKNVDVLCDGTGRSDLNLLFACGRDALVALSRLGVTGVLDGVGAPLLRSGFVLGTEAWCGAISEGTLDGAWDDSVLFRGKGNSSAGGIGRIFVPPFSSEVEEEFLIVGR